jgi:hypothetical protein
MAPEPGTSTSVRVAGACLASGASESTETSAPGSRADAPADPDRLGQSVGIGSCAALTEAAHNPTALQPQPLSPRKHPPAAGLLSRGSLLHPACDQARAWVPLSPPTQPSHEPATPRAEAASPRTGIPQMKIYSPVPPFEGRLTDSSAAKPYHTWCDRSVTLRGCME